MPDYMLDTDTVSYALRGYGRVAARVLDHRPTALCMSAITLAELRYGAEMKRSRKLRRLVDTFVKTVAVIPFDAEAAGRFGVVASFLARHGTTVGAVDALIGAHAVALSLTLVTHNLKHFLRIPGLRVESWV